MKAEVSPATKACPEPWRWSCYDEQATEVEVLALLAQLVRTLKPRLVVETGCYDGWGTAALVKGVTDNGFGFVHTCDLAHDKVVKTFELMEGYREYFSARQCSGVDLIQSLPHGIDFAFLDSGPDEVRCEELRVLLPKLSERGVVAVHDTGEQHGLRERFFGAVKELDLQWFQFDTPRGLSLVRRKP